MDQPRAARAFALGETVTLLFVILALIAVVVPTSASLRGRSRVFVSLDNLQQIGAAMSMYAADWNGRQPTYAVDDISSYGDTATGAIASYCAPGCNSFTWHPGVILGWGYSEDGFCVFYNYFQAPGTSGNHSLIQPINFQGSFSYFGSFRLMNAAALHRGYLGNRFYDPVFYAPDDTLPYDVVIDAFDIDQEYTNVAPSPIFGDIPVWSSYCTSPAAMFDPAVMRHPDDGGWQDPWLLDDGFRSPNLDQALYPDLKTLVLEHNWNQNRRMLCNPAFFPGTYLDGTCEPYYFNHGRASAPATLFYDLSVRLLPNKEVTLADQTVLKQTGSGLWSRDTSFGVDGYFNDVSFDDIDVSHHILTTDGIRGRDTTR